MNSYLISANVGRFNGLVTLNIVLTVIRTLVNSPYSTEISRDQPWIIKIVQVPYRSVSQGNDEQSQTWW